MIDVRSRRDALLYLGADADVHMLKLMAPWETTAVYMDTMGDEHSGLTDGYDDNHYDDPRPGFNVTTASMRPCIRHDCFEPLTHLLQTRLSQITAFESIRVLRNLTLTFHYAGIKRTLHYFVGHFPFHRQTTLTMLRLLEGRVSTVAAPGAIGILSTRDMRLMLDVVLPACLPAVTILAAEHEQEEVRRIGSVLPRGVHPYEMSDTLTGRRRRALSEVGRAKHECNVRRPCGRKMWAGFGQPDGFLSVYCLDHHQRDGWEPPNVAASISQLTVGHR